MHIPHLLSNTAPYMALAALLLCCLPGEVLAQADAAEAGRKLVQENKCEACHARKVGGDGTAIYTRKERRVTSWPKLKSQVALCNTELNIGLFPEDEEQIAVYLNSAQYKFTKTP